MNKDEAILFAAKFLEDIISFFGVNLAVSSSCEDDVIELSVPSSELNAILIGRNAETLRSLQNLISNILRVKNAELTRVNIDVADYKHQRQDRIAKRAEEWIRKVRQTGETQIIDLNAADRRIVHKVAQDYFDVATHSEGEGKDRKLYITKVDHKVEKVEEN